MRRATRAATAARGPPQWWIAPHRDAEALRDATRLRDGAPPSAPPAGADARGLRDGLYDLARRLSQTVDLHDTIDLLAGGLRELADAVDRDIWMPRRSACAVVASCDVRGFDRSVAGKTLPVESDVLEALADLALAPPVPAPHDEHS